VAASSVAAFWATALLLIIVPGADWAFILGSALRGQSVLPAVSGIVLGYAGTTVVVAAGVGALVAASTALLTALTVTGGLYLIWHGATTFARPAPPDAAPDATDAPARAGAATVVKGMGVSSANPKGLLLFLALLPQFTSPRWSWPLPAQLGFLGLVFTLSCAAFYLCIGSLARKTLRVRPAAARFAARLSGAGMIVIGAALLAERLIA
jgi:threonine/homoserine/homoserine lactone efflux protein